MEKVMAKKKTKKNREKFSDKKRVRARAGSMILYHVTSPAAADAILKTGFRDTTGNYGTDRLWSGVWLADRPLDINDTGRLAEATLEVTLKIAEAKLAEYEWVQAGKNYREWLIPAQIVNQVRVKLLPIRTDASSFNKRLGSHPVAILARSRGSQPPSPLLTVYPGIPSLTVETSRSMRAPLTWEGMLKRAGLRPEIFPYELGYEVPGHPYLLASGSGTATANRVLLYGLCHDQLVLARSEVETLQINTPQLVRSRREFFNYVPGKQPRVANMLVEDHLRPAAVKAGVLKEGEKVRFGFHNLRHSLASFLVRKGTDVKTVQKMLRHSDVSTTLGIYAHSMSEDRLAAQDDMLAAMMTPSNAVN
jgi:hypothetical protein